MFNNVQLLVCFQVIEIPVKYNNMLYMSTNRDKQQYLIVIINIHQMLLTEPIFLIIIHTNIAIIALIDTKLTQSSALFRHIHLFNPIKIYTTGLYFKQKDYFLFLNPLEPHFFLLLVLPLRRFFAWPSLKSRSFPPPNFVMSSSAAKPCRRFACRSCLDTWNYHD